MKKLLFPLFLSLSLLFTGCNSIYENHHRTTKVIINLPKITTSSSRKIYDSDIELSSDDNIEFTITLTSGSSEFNLTAKKGESIVFSNIPVGPCTITGLVSAPGLPDFAFGQIRQTIKLGTNNIDLTLSKNLLDNIKDIKVLKDISKTTYELGEPIDDNGAIYAIVLSNGYSFEYNKNELYSLEIGAEVRFKKCDEDEYNNNNRIVPDTNPNIYPSNNADRYYFIIDYHLFNKTKGIDFNKYSYATINAKTPVITKQPESTGISNYEDTAYSGRSIEYSFSVEVDTSNPNQLGTISYAWYSVDGICSGQAYETQGSETSSNYNIKIKGIYSLGTLSQYLMPYCEITNTDNRGGLNGNTISVAESQRAILFPFFTDNTASSVSDAYSTDQVTLKYKKGMSFIYDNNNIPSKNFFSATYELKKTNGGNIISIDLDDIDESLIEITDISPAKEDLNYSLGNIPYIVTYQYKKYTTDNSENQSLYSHSYVWTEKTQTIYVPTKLAKIPDYNFSLTQMANLNQQHGIDDQALERFYNFEDEKFYVKNKKDEYKEANYSGMKELHTNTVSAGIYQYSSSTTDPEYNTSCFEPSFKVYKEINGIRNAEIAINNSDINNYNNLPYVIYKLTDQDFNVIESGSTLRIFIECTLSVKEEYKNYFPNAQPVSITTDTVIFSRYIP